MWPTTTVGEPSVRHVLHVLHVLYTHNTQETLTSPFPSPHPITSHHIAGAASGAMSKSKQRKYRQYMNRTGGFNRALDKI